MRRTSFASMTCSVARALEQIGDGWTLLLIREAFYGTRRFKDFEAELGIASNTLSQRLAHLVTHGILRIVEADGAREYKLTDKGHDLFPLIVALVQWGDRHVAAPKGPPMRLLDRQTGQPLAPMQPRAADGRVLDPRDVTVAEGPGAGRADKKRFAQAHGKGLID